MKLSHAVFAVTFFLSLGNNPVSAQSELDNEGFAQNISVANYDQEAAGDMYDAEGASRDPSSDGVSEAPIQVGDPAEGQDYVQEQELVPEPEDY